MTTEFRGHQSKEGQIEKIMEHPHIPSHYAEKELKEKIYGNKGGSVERFQHSY